MNPAASGRPYRLPPALSRFSSREPGPGLPLSALTTFAIGGRADLLLQPWSEEDLAEVVKILAEEGIPFRLLGGGSDILVSDAGVRGVVVRIGPPLDRFRFEGKTLIAAAGAKLPALARAAAERGLSGLEFAVGIPGTAGGAAVTNAGSLGRDMAGIIRKVRVYRPGEGAREYSGGECGFVYRGSRFLTASEAVMEIACELHPAAPAAVTERMREIREERKRKFPLEWPSAGSVFKNPPGETAGRLIEAAGLKGFRFGGAGISEKHANWIVNLDEAKASDVTELIRLARERVEERSGIRLELEIEVWGEEGKW